MNKGVKYDFVGVIALSQKQYSYPTYENGLQKITKILAITINTVKRKQMYVVFKIMKKSLIEESLSLVVLLMYGVYLSIHSL